MKLKQFSVLVLCLLGIFLLNACDKHHAKKLSGTYQCAVNYRSWDMTGTNIDSNYTEDLVIKQDRKWLKILNYSIHIDSLWKENEYYEGVVHDYMKVQFKNDSIYLIRSSGGLGGSGGWTYKGKMKG